MRQAAPPVAVLGLPPAVHVWSGGLWGRVSCRRSSSEGAPRPGPPGGGPGPAPELYKDQNDTWVDRRAPAALQPYLKLIRIDRPIGAFALTPCAGRANTTPHHHHHHHLCALDCAIAVLLKG